MAQLVPGVSQWQMIEGVVQKNQGWCIVGEQPMERVDLL